MKNNYDFLEKKVKEVKQELKERKAWKSALCREYGLARTVKEHRELEIIHLIDVAIIMIEHYEKILLEYEGMLCELKEMNK